ncbi:MAG: hypothetical protein J6S69_03930, partial [Proteobacteria bacterium]|nr:hypothetical protein [Pseudomonadota bacterium]
LKHLGTHHRFDVFVSEPGTNHYRFLEKWGPAPPFFIPATYPFVNDWRLCVRPAPVLQKKDDDIS